MTHAVRRGGDTGDTGTDDGNLGARQLSIRPRRVRRKDIADKPLPQLEEKEDGVQEGVGDGRVERIACIARHDKGGVAASTRLEAERINNPTVTAVKEMMPQEDEEVRKSVEAGKDGKKYAAPKVVTTVPSSKELEEPACAPE